jgi:hypothetical protein
MCPSCDMWGNILVTNHWWWFACSHALWTHIKAARYKPHDVVSSNMNNVKSWKGLEQGRNSIDRWTKGMDSSQVNKPLYIWKDTQLHKEVREVKIKTTL